MSYIQHRKTNTEPTETDRELEGWPEFSLGEIERQYIGEPWRVHQCQLMKRARKRETHDRHMTWHTINI